MHFALFSSVSSTFVIILIEAAIWRLHIDDWSTFRFRTVFFEFLTAIFDEKLIDISVAKSIFSIDWLNSFVAKIWIEFSLKILTVSVIFADVEVDVWDDSKYFEFESFISIKIWSVGVLDNFPDNSKSLTDSDNSNNSNDLDDSNDLIDVLMLIWCIFTSVRNLLTFIDVFLFSRPRDYSIQSSNNNLDEF